MIVDNTQTISRSSNSPSTNSTSEVVIVANETNKTHVNESSDDDCYPSLDSLEYPPPTEFRDIKGPKVKKLDESEVLIVDSSYVINDSGLDVSEDNSRLLDTSHVSVVKIDEEKVQVKDSSAYGNDNLRGSTSDISNTSSGKGGSMKSDFGDEVKGTSIILEGSANDVSESTKLKMNGQVIHAGSREDLYKKGSLNGKIYPDSFESVISDSRSHSDSGSVRSSDSRHRRPVFGASKNLEQSDVESISLASHDSRGSTGKENKSDRMSEAGKLNTGIYFYFVGSL